MVVEDDRSLSSASPRLISCNPRTRLVGKAVNGSEAIALMHGADPDVLR